MRDSTLLVAPVNTLTHSNAPGMGSFRQLNTRARRTELIRREQKSPSQTGVVNPITNPFVIWPQSAYVPRLYI